MNRTEKIFVELRRLNQNEEEKNRILEKREKTYDNKETTADRKTDKDIGGEFGKKADKNFASYKNAILDQEDVYDNSIESAPRKTDINEDFYYNKNNLLDGEDTCEDQEGSAAKKTNRENNKESCETDCNDSSLNKSIILEREAMHQYEQEIVTGRTNRKINEKSYKINDDYFATDKNYIIENIPEKIDPQNSDGTIALQSLESSDEDVEKNDEFSNTDYVPDSTDEESSDSTDCIEEDIPLASFLTYTPGTENDLKESSTSTKSTKAPNVDEVILTFGKYLESPSGNVEEFSNVRPWTKKSSCPYCFKDVTHFPRHLIRNHKDKGAVKELVSLSPRDPKRKELLNIMRRQGNFASKSYTNSIRPVRRPKVSEKNTENLKENYIACCDCLGFFKRNYLRRHRKCCKSRSQSEIPKREQHLSAAQMFVLSSSGLNQFYSTLRLKNEVFPIMRNDVISNLAMGDTLICCYAESLLNRHKRTQIRNVVSNKMRELGRLLLALKNSTSLERLFDALRPQFFDNLVVATKVISGYDAEARSFKASSLAMHMGTSLKQVCDMAIKLIIKKSPMLPCQHPEERLKDIKRLRDLIENHWNSELSSLALKNLNEQRFKTAKLLPLTEDVMKFQKFLNVEAKKACNTLRENHQVKESYRRLSECVLAITLLLNRKRIGEIQYLKVETYSHNLSENQQTEFFQCLSETEKTLTNKFKRVITEGKGSKPVPILFAKDVQEFIEVLLSVRNNCVPDSNKYLFANFNTTNGWLSGYHTLRKLAEECGVSNKDLFTSTRLRKHIATILQVINMTEGEMEQLANFMGHTKKTHETFYRLPQDIYQTAKVSKLLLAVSQGNSSKYKGKSLEEIELTDNESDESDTDEENSILHSEEPSVQSSEETNTKPLEQQKKKRSKYTEGQKKKQEKQKKKIIARKRWTESEKKIVISYFKNHIKEKQAPRKQEVQDFLKRHNKDFKESSWVKIKAFVYNCYK